MARGPQPKPGILDISAYAPGKSPAGGARRSIKLNANENALGCSPLAEKSYHECGAALSVYPDMRATRLRAAISEAYGVEEDRLVFGAGSDELFTLAAQTFLSPGDNAVQPHYGFAAWPIAVMAAGGVMRSAPEQNFVVDVDAILAAVDACTRIVFVANPANPTGTVLPFTEIRRLHDGLREDILFVLDGAYSEFSGDAYRNEFELARAAPNILLTKTFSKIFGLAALRIGWGYGSPEIIAALDRIRPPFNTTAPAQAAAIGALADTDFIQRSVDYVTAARAGLAEFFRSLDLCVVPSAANFLTVRFPDGGAGQAQRVLAGLAQRGVFVRGLANYAIADALRVTIGPPGDLARFREAFIETLKD